MGSLAVAHAPAHSARPFFVLAKPIGPVCNLDCGYCYYTDKERLYPAARAMPPDVLESFVRQYIEAQPTPVVSFLWQGGEPTLLGVAYFEDVVRLQRKHAGTRRIENALQTNGLRLDEAWGAFLARERFLVGLSLDGPRPLHDSRRTGRGGAPTFDGVMHAFDVLKRHRVAFNTLTVLHHDNVRRPLEVYRFLRDAGSRHLQFIPAVERRAARRQDALTLAAPDEPGEVVLTEWSVGASDFGLFLWTVFEEWVRHDVGRVFVQTFETALAAWMGEEPSLCIHRRTCGDALAVEHNGDVYPCDHYVFPEHKLGNLMVTPLAELAALPRQRRFGDAKAELPDECLRCDVLLACRGGCPKHRFVRVPEGRSANYLCDGYRSFLHSAAPYLRRMAGDLVNERPATTVMAWAREHRRTTSPRPRRFDPCPCGSGKVFKICCARRR